jgi:hypothetical protein
MRLFGAILLCGLLWAACRRWLRARTPPGAFSCGAAALAAASGLLSVLGMVLAFAGRFRPAWIVPVVLTLAAVAWRDAARGSRGFAPPSPRPPAPRAGATATLAQLALLLGGLGLFFRPGEHLPGAWDPGVYLSTGAHIARQGSWLIRDTASPLYTPEEKHAAYGHTAYRFVKYPGFYVDHARTDALQPQFYPLYPVWIAWLELAGGPRAGLYASSLFAWLSLLMLLLAAREIGGRLCSLIAGAALLFNPVQVWFSGFHTAELAMQFFFLAGLWLWLVWHRSASRAAAALAGAMFALTAFASVTGLLLAGLAAGAHAVASRARRDGAAFLVPLLALAPLSVYQNAAMTPQYFSSVSWSPAVLLRTLADPRLLGALAALLAVGLLWRWRGPVTLLPRRGAAGLFGCVALAGGAWLVWTLYGRAPLPPRWLAAASLLSKTGLLCAYAGMCLLAWRRPALAPLLVVVPAVFAYLFLRHGLMTPLYPWAFKRWLAVALPAACLFSGFLWAGLAAWHPRPAWTLLALALAGAIVARTAWRGRAFALERDWPGMAAHLDRVNDRIPAGAIVLARRDLGTPLEFRYGRTVLPNYRDPQTQTVPPALQAVVRRCLERGQTVCAVRDTAESLALPLHAEPLDAIELRSSTLAQSRTPFNNRRTPRELRTVVEILAARPAPP